MPNLACNKPTGRLGSPKLTIRDVKHACDVRKEMQAIHPPGSWAKDDKGKIRCEAKSLMQVKDYRFAKRTSTE
jgi:hypothetical protein